jgi:hypothetical protein
MNLVGSLVSKVVCIIKLGVWVQVLAIWIQVDIVLLELAQELTMKLAFCYIHH